MYNSEDLINLVHAEVARVLHRTTRRTPVVVDGYDKEKHAVRLKLMPESKSEPVLTGWVPLHTSQTGNKRGLFTPPNVGDHGWVEFHDDDREGGTFTHAAFNDKFPPDATVEAGEFKYIHPGTETQIYFKKDGSITIRGQKTDGHDNSKQTVILGADGSTTLTDGTGDAKILLKDGKVRILCSTFTVVSTGDAGIHAGGVGEFEAGGKLGLDGAPVVVKGGGSVSDGSVTPPSDQSPVPPFEVP